MSYRPAPAPASNLVTLGADVHDYYHQDQYEDEDSDGYETDSDDGPYWQVSLNTQPRHRANVNEEYKDEDEEEEEEEDYYAEPAYEIYPVEQFSTQIAEAREKASRMPGKIPPQQKFEGAFPPPQKEQPLTKPPSQQTQPVPIQKPAAQPSAPPIVNRTCSTSCTAKSPSTYTTTSSSCTMSSTTDCTMPTSTNTKESTTCRCQMTPCNRRCGNERCQQTASPSNYS